jgi:hypothetical protein
VSDGKARNCDVCFLPRWAAARKNRVLVRRASRALPQRRGAGSLDSPCVGGLAGKPRCLAAGKKPKCWEGAMYRSMTRVPRAKRIHLLVERLDAASGSCSCSLASQRHKSDLSNACGSSPSCDSWATTRRNGSGPLRDKARCFSNGRLTFGPSLVIRRRGA